MHRLRFTSSGDDGQPNNRRNALRTLRRDDTIGILLLGRCEVGKTALVNQWVNDTFVDTYTPTIEDFYEKSLNLKGQTVNISLIDMTGTSDFPAMIDLYLNRVDSVLLVYDVTNDASAKELRVLYNRVSKVREQREDLMVTIVGTKADILDDMGDYYRNEVVDEILRQVGECGKHVMTSAKLNLNVNDAFIAGLSNMAPSIVPSEDTIKRLGKLMKKNKRRCFCFEYCCIL